MTTIPRPNERPWLTVDEVATITGEGSKAIRHAIDAGQIPSLRIGRYVRIPTQAFRELVGLDVEDSATAEAATSTAADGTSTTRAEGVVTW